jgi:oxygen-independent coproporphyrinogen-3 oxidase
VTPADLARKLDRQARPVRHLYIHLPFCQRICPYCDFSTVVAAGADTSSFLSDLKLETRLLGECGLLSTLQTDGGTLFLGGGTPSWFGPDDLEQILNWLTEVAPGRWLESTLEMNPEDADNDRLQVLRAGGISRLSLGAQSMSTDVLRRLGRIHTPDQVVAAVEAGRLAGFHLSIDLIFAVPGQQMQEWQRDVARVLELGPDHVSLYNLTFELGTPFTRWRASGRIKPLDDAWEADAYLWALERLRSEGYKRYEVSNFARPGYESVHNRAYWSGVGYLGLGPSAHSLLGDVRTANAFRADDWSSRLHDGEVPWESLEQLDDLTVARERVLLGLRTDDGLALNDLPPGYRDGIIERAQPEIERGLALLDEPDTAGRSEGSRSRLRLTDAGMLLADALAERIAP